MSATTHILLAYAAVILGLAGYIGFLVSRSAGLGKREQQIKLLEDNRG